MPKTKYSQNTSCTLQYKSTHFGFDKVIVNTEWQPESVYGPTHETEIYSLIENHGIGPRSLAHVAEIKDRGIGYMVERVT